MKAVRINEWGQSPQIEEIGVVGKVIKNDCD